MDSKKTPYVPIATNLKSDLNMGTLNVLYDPTWLVRAKIDGEWSEVRYSSKERAMEAARSLIEDHGLSSDEVVVIDANGGDEVAISA